MAEFDKDKKSKGKRTRKRKIRTADSAESSDGGNHGFEAEKLSQPHQAKDDPERPSERGNHDSAKATTADNSPKSAKENGKTARQPAKRTKSKHKKEPPKPSSTLPPSPQPPSLPNAQHEAPNTTPPPPETAPTTTTAATTDFESWYLRKLTSEFAEDLDKIRSAPDFHDSSLPILIEALKHGASIFTEEEQRRILEGARP